MQKNILSKKLNLGLVFSTPNGGVTSPSLKGSMAQTHKLSQMDIQPSGVQDHFLLNVLKFGFGDWKNVYETRRPNPIFPQNLPKIGYVGGENGKKYMKREENKYLFIFAYEQDFSCIILYALVMILSNQYFTSDNNSKLNIYTDY